VPRLDLVFRRLLDQSAKFLTLFFGNRRPQILDFGSELAHKNNQRGFENSADPRIADELRVERKQAFRCLRVTAGRRLPIDQARYAVDFADGVEVSNKFAASRENPVFLYLQIPMGIVNTYAIVPRKCFEQMDPLMQQAIPGFSFLVLKGRVAIGSPLLKERGSAILFAEVGTQCVLKAPSEGHARARFFFLPAVQIAIPIASRTPQVLADLRVAIDHRRLLAPCFVPGTRNREPPNLPPEIGRASCRERVYIWVWTVAFTVTHRS